MWKKPEMKKANFKQLNENDLIHVNGGSEKSESEEEVGAGYCTGYGISCNTEKGGLHPGMCLGVGIYEEEDDDSIG
ncbi:MAG: bacteriocin [Candidatus Mcinerneyibacterium aminivorans]|jgi:bacteriocin-like protein|uniref:Bacteriocin n=1 Tax=Candidatus Mcinerneyibacterium aminivorans TaxID=2703815 RepID=A0A5D0MEI1_9BACT|nr:MAG: bacteriocin [Candidatus Mcinerneyibacterium aminivorans]